MSFLHKTAALATVALSLLTGAAHAQLPEINLRRTITVEVIEKTKNAVVYISTTKVVSQRFSPFGEDPFFEQFGPSEIRRVPVGSLGSGFIVHPEGYIITNNHVIDRARQVNVELLDGRKFPAEIISADAEADLAILKISTDAPLPTLELGDSSDLLIGEPVIAVGNPLGFSHTVSTGIVSAVHRDLKADNNKVLLGDLIQTDAAINPGNSGGPLLNAYGQVIGINTAIRGDAQNIGFAIQVNTLRDKIPALMNPSQVTKVQVPVVLREIRTVTPPSTVAVKLVRGEDQREITAINGQQPRNIVDAYAILLKQQPEQTVKISYSDGKTETVGTENVPVPDTIVKARRRLGVTVEAMTPMLAQKYGVDQDSGMLVTEVASGSVAARAGIRPGDIIVRLGPYPVQTLKDFGVLLEHMPEAGRVRIQIVRGAATGFGYLDL